MTTLNFQSASPSDSLTPLMRQYTSIKEKNPGTVLLYRMGDFYEMFNDDAKIASKVLGLTLTSRNHGSAEDVPLAGFPYHALDRYANRLVKAGYKIAICEQTEDPKNAKGIVKRDIIEVISAGTATEDNFIEEKSNNYIVGVVCPAAAASAQHGGSEGAWGVAICDLSTGVFEVEEVSASRLVEELVRIDPSEILCSDADAEGPAIGVVSKPCEARSCRSTIPGNSHLKTPRKALRDISASCRCRAWVWSRCTRASAPPAGCCRISRSRKKRPQTYSLSHAPIAFGVRRPRSVDHPQSRTAEADAHGRRGRDAAVNS